MSYQLLQGDVMGRLEELPDESVHCVVTSPPYWGLRDYGTGTWEGGEDPFCEHKVRLDAHVESSTQGGGKATTGHSKEGYGKECGRCGAVRNDSQIGLEKTPQEYVDRMVLVFSEIWRVLRNDGTVWLNMGDSYCASGGNTKTKSAAGLKQKDLVGIPWRVAFALQADGWYLRQDIIWAKPNPMPESVTDRCTKAHEYLFLLTKSAHYYYDSDAISEPSQGDYGEGKSGKWAESAEDIGSIYGIKQVTGNQNKGRLNKFSGATRNKRDVWTIATASYKDAHFAVFPEKLVEPCVLAGTSEKGYCVICGAPWLRKLERTEVEDSSAKGSKFDQGKTGERDGGERTQKGPRFVTRFVGWESSCGCNEFSVSPGVVLDPFSGAATTGVVALKHNRNYIGIELNPEYIEMSRRRLEAL